MSELPCYVLPSSTPVEKLKEIVIKDNGSFGSWDWDWDWDELANNWDDLDLIDWGMNAWKGENSTDSISETGHYREAY